MHPFRNILMIALLTLSSFGSMVCADSTKGGSCNCSVLIRATLALATASDCDNCPCDFPDESPSDNCEEELVSIQSNLMQGIEYPAQPPLLDLDLIHTFLSFTFSAPTPVSLESRTRSFLRESMLIPPLGNIGISTIVLRL